ncbi:MAG: ribonuclease HI [Phycisphaerae bacterium]|nr:ribonuclease HI [Phycisphaerae bacterium]
MAQFELFTDGACSGNPGPGGWAFILRVAGQRPGSCEESVSSGAELRTTNNRMELLAVIRGLEEVPVGSAVTVTTDSEYAVKGLREWLDGWKARGWRKADKKPVQNVDLWQRLDELRQRVQVTPQWIRGHNAHPENERCDRLAVEAIQELQRNG